MGGGGGGGFQVVVGAHVILLKIIMVGIGDRAPGTHAWQHPPPPPAWFQRLCQQMVSYDQTPTLEISLAEKVGRRPLWLYEQLDQTSLDLMEYSPDHTRV